MNTFDNIVAPATGIGGAITIIRLSGPEALTIAGRVWRGRVLLSEAPPRTMYLGKVGSDPALAVYMKAPASYTGDDVVELHCHGGAAAAEQALKLILAAGCRMAEAGEFTFRAFVNGKLDLVQAEAVNDVVSAGSEMSLKLAEKQLAGALSTRLETLYEELRDLCAEAESHLDFPDEELTWEEGIPQRILAVEAELRRLLSTREIGATLRDGVNLVIAGRPNAGKSSLLNRLLGQERAIVTAIPGTTRDTIEATTVLRGLPVHLTDTAGLRHSDDPIEQLGVERSCRSIEHAQVTFWLLDSACEALELEVAEMNRHAAPGRIAVWNKIDLAPERALPKLDAPTVRISARTGEGIEELLDAFARLAVNRPWPELPEVAVNTRHAGLLELAAGRLPEAANHFENGEFELAGLLLRETLHTVGEIIGKTVKPDILDNIFSKFCIGK